MDEDLKGRLKAENDELCAKLKKLHDFLQGVKTHGVSPLQFRLLQIQYDSMKSYQGVLQLRIEHLEGYWGDRTEKMPE